MSAPVITGLGVIAPNGIGLEDYWSATLRGVSGIRQITRFDATSYPARLAGEVVGFEPRDHLPARLLPQTDRVTRLSLAAADWALADACLDSGTYADSDMGVVTASTAGGFEFGQRELEHLWAKGGRYVSAYQSFAWFYAVNTGQISIRHGLRGPSGVIVTDHSGGLESIAQARRLIRRGASLIVTGAVDGSLCPWSWTAELTRGELSTRDDPRTAYLPFDVSAAGYVAGEGGAILIMEDAARARERGPRQVYGTVAGYGATFEPRPGSGRPPALRRAITLALAEAGWEPADVDVVFADAAGVPALDHAEAAAITEVFGTYTVPVTAPKTMTGRLAAGGAALDAATALLSLRDQVIPPTAHVTDPVKEYRIDLVLGEPRPARLRRALVLARGHGGFNAALALSDAAG